MGAPARRFVSKPNPTGPGWRVWDNLRKRWWGRVYTKPPTELLVELNGKKDGGQIARSSTENAITEFGLRMRRTDIGPRPPVDRVIADSSPTVRIIY